MFRKKEVEMEARRKPWNGGKEEVQSSEDEEMEVKDEPLSESEEEEEEESEGSGAEEEGEEEQAQRTAIRQELADLTFEELEALKKKMGLKLYEEAMFGSNAKQTASSSGRKKKLPVFKRENKNRPRELSAKIRVPRVREVIHVKKVVKKDPRFDDACGELREDLWDKNYQFLREMQQKEVQELKKTLKNRKDPEEAKEVKRFIQRVKDKETAKVEKAKLEEKKRLERVANKKRVQEGKKPYFVKKSTQKLLDLADKFEELKQTGKLEKYMKKKRKKNQSRDKRVIPSSVSSSTLS